MGEEWCKGVFRQVVDAVQHIHSKQILHRDLKCDNILLCDDVEGKGYPNVKLIDFGAAKWCKEGPFTGKKFIGTVQTVAPEVIFARGDDFDAGEDSTVETTHEITYKNGPLASVGTGLAPEDEAPR